jgi:hypothetical protein
VCDINVGASEFGLVEGVVWFCMSPVSPQNPVHPAFLTVHDYQVTETLRLVQLTPPGSACSIVMGTGMTEMAPGSQKGVQVVVADVEAARRELIERGVQASDVDVQPWGSFVTFSDPDGNTWALQQLPPRP